MLGSFANDPEPARSSLRPPREANFTTLNVPLMFSQRTLILCTVLLLNASAHAERRIKDSHIQEFREWMRGRPMASAKALPETAEQALGAALYSDKNLSLNRNQSCATCHSLDPAKSGASGALFPAAGFVDPLNITPGIFVSNGSVVGKFGTLNTPSVGYAGFSPSFRWNKDLEMFQGGQFWNGRAATLEDQAALPMLNPVEMAMPSKWAIVTRLKENPAYRDAFKKLYKLDLDSIPANENAPAEAKAPRKVGDVVTAASKAIAAFEKGRTFNRFTSKFDFYLAGMTELTPQEKTGLDLFVGTAACATCHTAEPGITADGKPFPPLFTDFTYENIGLPPNPLIPGNPKPDLGLGARPDIKARPKGDRELGKHKVVSLRNIAVTPPYGHNGVFPTLESIVHFYITRDSLQRIEPNEAGFGVTGWPAPEYPETVNRDNEMGSMHLTAEEELAVVAFLKTLTDDYPSTGGDPKVPAGTPSPFSEAVFNTRSVRAFGEAKKSPAKRGASTE